MFVENKYVGVYVKIIFAFVITLFDFLLKYCDDALGALWLLDSPANTFADRPAI